MARHRNADATRTISRGPVIGVASVLVLTLLVLSWFQVRGNVDEQSAEAAAQCVDGTSTLALVAEPDVAPVLTDLAERYTASEPVVRDQCISVTVTAAESQDVLGGLQDGWDTATLGPQPAAWVAPDSGTAARLPVDGAVSRPEELPSLTTSPVVLAAPSSAASAVGADVPSWARIAELQAAERGWAALGQPGWGRLTVALPTSSTATAAALQAVAADVAGTTPTVETVAQPAVTAAVSALGEGPDPQPADLGTALDELASLTEPAALTDRAGGGYQLVPATAQQVQAHGGALEAVSPAGATPVLDYPYVAITAPWVDDTQARAAGAWREHLTEPAQQEALSEAGFTAGDGVGPVPATMTPPVPAVSDALLDAASSPPPLALRSTVLLDVFGSSAPGAGDTTRLAATTSALRERFGALSGSSAVGLRTSSGLLDPAPLAEDGNQRDALDAALDDLAPQPDTSLYAVLQAAYAEARADAAPEAADSLLVIADGPDDDPVARPADVLAAISEQDGAGTGVRIDVITLRGADVEALGGIAEATGGTLIEVGDVSGPDLAAALAQLLP